MDAVLAKVEGATSGVELLCVLAELQKLLVGADGLEVARADAGKLALIAGVTAWREGHDAPEWTQVTAMVFGEVLKAFDKAVGVVAVEMAAAAAAVAAAAEAAEAAAAPILAAQLAASRVRIEELEKINEDLLAELKGRDAHRAKELEANKVLADKIRELEARQEAQEAERKEEAALAAELAAEQAEEDKKAAAGAAAGGYGGQGGGYGVAANPPAGINYPPPPPLGPPLGHAGHQGVRPLPPVGPPPGHAGYQGMRGR